VTPGCWSDCMSKPTPPTYRMTNWRSCNAALKQRGSLHIWFDPATVCLAEPSGKRGRSATITDAAIQACLTLKALFGLPLRQTTGRVASLLELVGLDWVVPDFSTLSRRQKGLNVAIPYRPGTGALHLLIDSTGIKAEGEGEWFARKHGPSKPRQWRKVHLGIDADTLEIRVIEVTGSRIGDAPMLPELLNQISADQPIGKVSADGA
jgi:Transposase DDE domain